ncbi:hypothetical protein CIG75_00995 [Tumebacillus algifaecis]|uniref:DUF1761 domain-containing protein n=1 Tax=Tumebacillus algifaecis TaxID=1214604 RepID=A0A223CWK7_9BACL|nr:DUF1761 domain-containing protein [Tumebacillus algifaecis]ASS73690.1 hypothetical protein CIG75_00995 [Tumebacillus algifaecis]
MTFELSELNVWAILLGGLLYMAFGALYYSPLLFGNTWVRANGLQDTYMNNPMLYVGAAIVAFASSFLIAVIVQVTGADDILSALGVGLSVGLLAALGLLKNTLFGMTTRKVFAIAIGDHLIAFTLLSILHVMWP